MKRYEAEIGLGTNTPMQGVRIQNQSVFMYLLLSLSPIERPSNSKMPTSHFMFPKKDESHYGFP